jgi:hypothetical protein
MKIIFSIRAILSLITSSIFDVHSKQKIKYKQAVPKKTIVFSNKIIFLILLVFWINASFGQSACATPWSTSTQYCAGTVLTYNGFNYQACFCSTNTTPTSSFGLGGNGTGWANNRITISGTRTVARTYSFSITLKGSCGGSTTVETYVNGIDNNVIIVNS